MQCPACGYSTDKSPRSNNQNRYYWGIVLKRISEHTGFTIDETHEVLKAKFLRAWKSLDTKKGYIEVEYAKSTRDLNTKEFEDYMTQIREWASIDIGVWVPEPNEDEPTV